MPDLSEYSYIGRYARPGLLAVGWLDCEHPFRSGEVPQATQERLWLYCRRRIAQTRGLHVCNICQQSESEPVTVVRDGVCETLGSAEIRVFSAGGAAFAAPDLVYHYIGVHRYLPPQAFLDAVMTGPLPGSDLYEEMIQEYALHNKFFGWR